MAFTPGVDAAILEDLTARLQRTRLHDGAAKRLGTGNDRLRALVEHWLREFDWAAVEQAMSDLGSATTTTEDGRRLHYLHLPGQDADGERLPVLLLHGWPDTALQFAHLMPLLAAAGHPVVAPTAAGFGFSDEPSGEPLARPGRRRRAPAHGGTRVRALPRARHRLGCDCRRRPGRESSRLGRRTAPAPTTLRPRLPGRPREREQRREGLSGAHGRLVREGGLRHGAQPAGRHLGGRLQRLARRLAGLADRQV